MGQTLPTDFAPLPPDVRCCSKSDHLRRECEMTLRAIFDHFAPQKLPRSTVAFLSFPISGMISLV
jgi:hypothetical protein